MPPKFGTSGLRGLVTELTPDFVSTYIRAFVGACPTGNAIRVGWDLRPSSPQIAETVIDTLTAAGHTAIVDGPLPTPALALAALEAGQSAIMITGSHIPADRNGLKFYTPTGEITKSDEQAILGHLEVAQRAPATPAGGSRQNAQDTASAAYVARYVTGFGADALTGWRIGVYQHSSVARDILVDVVTSLGAEAVALARSDTFIPVDTEAVDQDTRAQLANWCTQHQLDALISTDGDADRPMVTDASGKVVPGDVLGALTAQCLGATTLCTPVSSNTMIDQMPGFTALHRTRIGSPFVIAAMEQVLGDDPSARVVGYEANGGFLLGFQAQGPTGPLSPLMTRDCVLPILAPLALAHRCTQSLADLCADLPARFTAADRLTGIPPETSQPFLESLRKDAQARQDFFSHMGAAEHIDHTDGLRITFAGNHVVHLRPSGNAPEFRCYVEAGNAEQASALLDHALRNLRQAFQT